MELNNIIFSVLLILFVFFLSKSFLHIFNKAEFQILKDKPVNFKFDGELITDAHTLEQIPRIIKKK